MSRQQAFEAIYAKQHDVPAGSLVKYRFKFKDGYSLPRIASHYRTYCLAMDSIIITLPSGGYYAGYDNDHYMESDLVREAIEEAGVKYK